MAKSKLKVGDLVYMYDKYAERGIYGVVAKPYAAYVIAIKFPRYERASIGNPKKVSAKFIKKHTRVVTDEVIASHIEAAKIYGEDGLIEFSKFRREKLAKLKKKKTASADSLIFIKYVVFDHDRMERKVIWKGLTKALAVEGGKVKVIAMWDEENLFATKWINVSDIYVRPPKDIVGKTPLEKMTKRMNVLKRVKLFKDCMEFIKQLDIWTL